MEKLQLLSTFILLVISWSEQYVSGQGPSDVGLSLNGTVYQNNSLVNLEDIGLDDDALLCTTANTACCSRSESPGEAILGQWFYPNGSAVADRIVNIEGDMWEFYRTRGPSIVRLNRRRGGVTGIYRCEIPDTTGVNQTMYIGLYTANTGAPNVTNMTFIGQTATLTCTSTGGPATNVTWRRDGVVIMPNATYQQTKRVIDNSTSTYQTVLTIDPSVDQSGILGTYNCTVENVRGLSSRTVVAVLVSMEGNPTLGQQYTLICNVNTALGPPIVQWVGPGSSAPIVTGGDFTVSSTSPYTLTINPLRQSRAGQYTCLATVGSDTGTASVTVDVAVPNPPEMFHIESVTTTSLNFSWQAPTVTNGMLTSYQVLCQPLIFGIPIPRTINPAPTEVTALLDNLFPGVEYNCSIIARNRAGASNPTYTAGTTLETAVTSTPENFTVLPKEQNLTFSWSPPTPTGRNGVITSYFFSCVPVAGGGNSISNQYTAAGTFTLAGFTPATSYNCSISASNSQGSGPATHRVVNTLDDAMLFQLQLSGTGLRDCQEWVGIATSAKLNDIINGVLQDINQHCRCGVSAERITESAFQCFENSEQQVTFRARLRGTGQASSSQLIAHLQTFVAQADSTIAVQGVRLDVDGSCSIVINSFGDPQCTTASPSVTTPMTTSDSMATMTPQSDNTAAIIGGVVTVVIAVTLAVTVAIIAIVAFVTKSRKRQFTIHQNVGLEPPKWSDVSKSGEDITTTHCEAYELANLSHEYEDVSEYQNTEYEIPITQCPAYVPTRKSGE